MGVTWGGPKRARASIECDLNTPEDAEAFALAVKVAEQVIGKRRRPFVHVVAEAKR